MSREFIIHSCNTFITMHTFVDFCVIVTVGDGVEHSLWIATIRIKLGAETNSVRDHTGVLAGNGASFLRIYVYPCHYQDKRLVFNQQLSNDLCWSSIDRNFWLKTFPKVVIIENGFTYQSSRKCAVQSVVLEKKSGREISTYCLGWPMYLV